MAATITMTSGLKIDGTYNAGATGHSNLDRVQAGSDGSNSAILPNFGLTYGTGTVVDSNGLVPVNDWYIFQGTIAAGATKSIDLIGGADVNPFGTALAFTVLKYALVGIISPDGIIKVQIGPRGVSNAWQGPWGGTGVTVYQETQYRWEWTGPAAGIAVTAGTGDLFLVKNPGAADLTCFIFLAGKY